MFISFVVLWIIFNGAFSREILAFGIVIAAVMYLFACLCMGYSVQKDFRLCRCFPYFLRYIGILFIEIIKANFSAMRLIFYQREEIQPVLVKFHVHSLRSKVARVILANSITLTPGTITVSLNGDEFYVHCLDESLMEGLWDGVFVKELQKIERVAGL